MRLSIVLSYTTITITGIIFAFLCIGMLAIKLLLKSLVIPALAAITIFYLAYGLIKRKWRERHHKPVPRTA